MGQSLPARLPADDVISHGVVLLPVDWLARLSAGLPHRWPIIVPAYQDCSSSFPAVDIIYTGENSLSLGEEHKFQLYITKASNMFATKHQGIHAFVFFLAGR